MKKILIIQQFLRNFSTFFVDLFCIVSLSCISTVGYCERHNSIVFLLNLRRRWLIH